MKIRGDIKVIARQALTTTVCNKLLNANATRWEEHKQSLPPFVNVPWLEEYEIQMDWLWKLLESYNNCTFSTWKNIFYSICYFGSLIRFAHFMIMLGEELPSLPPQTARHWSFIIQNFEQLAHALKTKVCPEIFHCFEIFLSFMSFEELALALKA